MGIRISTGLLALGILVWTLAYYCCYHLFMERDDPLSSAPPWSSGLCGPSLVDRVWGDPHPRFIILHPLMPQPRNGGGGTSKRENATAHPYNVGGYAGFRTGKGAGSCGRRWFHQSALTRTGLGGLIRVSHLSNPYIPYTLYRYRERENISLSPRCVSGQLFHCANRFNQTSFAARTARTLI